MRLAILLLATSSALLPAVGYQDCRADTWHVPFDAPTIQAGVDSAGIGDLVLVACGIYPERILMHSGITLRGETGDPGCVIIDGQELGSVLTLLGVSNTTVEDLTIIGGQALEGAGAYCDLSSPTFNNCHFRVNHAIELGGAVYARGESVVFNDCTFVDNHAGYGAGIWTSTATVTISGCTFHDNFNASGGGTISETGLPSSIFDIENTIIAFNSAGSSVQLDGGGSANLSCCDFYGNPGGDWVGEIAPQLGTNGNISLDPLFYDPPGGDLRLQSESPCAPDFNPACGLIGAWPVAEFTVNPVPGQGDFDSIQEAVDAVPDGSVILMADGTYSGPGNVDIDPGCRALTFTSESGNPGDCIIDCGGAPGTPHRAFWFHCNEDHTTVVSNITIRNGFVSGTRSGSGGGILCDDYSSPTIHNVVFEQNRSSSGGGGLHCGLGAAPDVDGVVFRENESDSGGGGLHCSQDSHPTVSFTTFAENVSHTAGGGLYCEDGSVTTLSYCSFVRNSAPVGGGIYVADGAVVDVDHSIIGFSLEGAGVDCAGGGVANLTCSDVYDNAEGDWIGCIAGQLGVSGNISLNPLICDLENHDYRLAANSPCAPDNNPACGQIGALLVGCGNRVPEPQSILLDGVNDFLPANLVVYEPGDTELPNIDLRKVYLTNDAVSLFVGIDQDPAPWTGVQLGIAVDTGTFEGGISDPWGRRLEWGSANLRPDFIFYVNLDSNWQEGFRWNGLDWEPIGTAGPGALGWITDTGFKELGILLATLGVTPPTTINVETWVTQDGENKGPLDCSANDLVQLSRPSGTAWDVPAPIPMFGYHPHVVHDLTDTEPPVVVEIQLADALECDQFNVVFNEPVDPVTALDPGNYLFMTPAGPFPVDPYVEPGTPDVVRLDLAVCFFASPDLFSITVSNVEDYAGNPILENGETNLGCFALKGAIFNGDMADYLAENSDPPDGFTLEGDSPPLTWDPCDTAEMFPSGGDAYQFFAIFLINADCVSGEAVLELQWKCLHNCMNWEPLPANRVTLLDIATGAVDDLEFIWGENPTAVAPVQPTALTLAPNVPNPFNPVTTIRYGLPSRARVWLRIFDVSGRLVRTLKDGVAEAAGFHETSWDGTDGRGKRTASGTYFYRLEAGSEQKVRAMVLLK